MVRLKDQSTCTLAGITCQISIPYGAIKSFDTITIGANAYLFQFLMVRLKAKGLLYRYFIKAISIPYGAIKSFSKCIIANCLQIISIPYGAIKR